MNEWSLMVLFRVQSYAQRGKSGRGKKIIREGILHLYGREDWGGGKPGTINHIPVFLYLSYHLTPCWHLMGVQWELGTSEDHGRLAKKPWGLMPTTFLQRGKLKPIKQRLCYSHYIPE